MSEITRTKMWVCPDAPPGEDIQITSGDKTYF